ncbi:glycosyltransferase family 4 protein [Litorilinea aerophila]|uniref:Glycosyltransferase family 4 protein n=1 Tax=Litorilinea aerophila TaxID=1204385 RepID=A0A540V964_9CHLR|nr:glycosyltransferase family 4 protein [Litorilinea aerophila]MCC9078805.1 glycosyltransferase family 4 protein [Litorilinea aerophila]
MNIWLVHVGELLPIDGDVRLFRYGILANMLVERGHRVTRWAPTFIHAYKRQRSERDASIWVNPNYRIELIYAKGYDRNVSLQRVRFHRQLERGLRRRMFQEPPPDIILAGIPTPGMCFIALQYAQHYDVPFVIDVRDLWPDIYLTLLPKHLRPIARPALFFAERTNRKLFRGASSIIAVSESYLKWGLRYAGRQRQSTDVVFPLGYPKPSFPKRVIEQEKRQLIGAGVDPEKTIICFFGQFETSYDLETIIDGARLLQERGVNDVQFVFCGSGSKFKLLRKRAEGLQNVVFPGWISAQAISALLQLSKIGLAPYAAGALQSLPNKPLEYLSGGLPVLSSLTGELQEILEQYRAGLTYRAGDVTDFLVVLEQLVGNPNLRSQMEENARRLFVEQFSVEKIYPAMVDYLEQIATSTFKSRSLA